MTTETKSKLLARLALKVSQTDLSDPMSLILMNIELAQLAVLARLVLEEPNDEV